MPCYQVNKVSIKFHVKNKDRLIQVLKDQGYNVRETSRLLMAGPMTFDLETGQVDLPTYKQSELNAIKRRYSEKTLEEIAKRKRWAFKKTQTGRYQMNRY